ncbi:hypothetical protein [Streptomyces fodineus]|uniref:hypothetical protein n=1 Tax=Streptomyces fodineus TaxID=1904616 RepID=UPI00131EC1AB|nr:hypothetical protein [Streptomyces fodineus]
MTNRQRLILWGSTAVAGLALIGLSAYLGLQKANEIAGIVSAVTGIIALALGIYQIVQGQRSTGGRPSPRQVQRGGNNSTNIQSGGDLTIGDNNQIGRDR